MAVKGSDRLAGALAELALEDFTPRFGGLADRFADHARWQALRGVGSELWLDSGDIEAIGRLWTRQFSAVTTNNTLLNKEVQKGQYDELMRRAAGLIRGQAGRRVGDEELALEIAFVLNARHGLRLVEAFDAFVSVEEHTALAHDVEGALLFARRFHAVCPERFYVKIPLTPAGLIAARRAADESIPVNLTLGFSARQNYLAARLARPAFVNVFLGRLNAFVADNELGDGRNVGERATLASQQAVRRLRDKKKLATRQIAASIRSGAQAAALAGVDVLTIPTAAAEELLRLEPFAPADHAADKPAVSLAQEVRAADVALDTLWKVPAELGKACDELDRLDPKELAPADLVSLLQDHGVDDLLVNWTNEQVQISRREGKIPELRNWQEGLGSGQFGLDALMNLAGLNSFAADQAAMDEKVRQALG